MHGYFLSLLLQVLGRRWTFFGSRGFSAAPVMQLPWSWLQALLPNI
jgi:hypothetical protein